MDRFIYLPEYRVIICKECKYAVLPSHIDAHFTQEDHKLEKDERRRIAEEVASVDGLISNEEVLRRGEFPFPPATSRPIKELAAPKKDGLCCMFEVAGKTCNYI
jgi:hypothetical protein